MESKPAKLRAYDPASARATSAYLAGLGLSHVAGGRGAACLRRAPIADRLVARALDALRIRDPLTLPCDTLIVCRGVAQPGSASGLGPEGRGFKSLRPDHFPNLALSQIMSKGFLYGKHSR